MSHAVRFTSISLALLFVAVASAGPAAPRRILPVVGYLPAADAKVDAALIEGLRAGLSGQDVRLVVARRTGPWSNAAPETVRLVAREGARVLVTPPGRRVAHLMAQVATRTAVALVSTSPSPTVGATGSRWVTCLHGVSARSNWRSVGRRAAAAVLAHLARH